MKIFNWFVNQKNDDTSTFRQEAPFGRMELTSVIAGTDLQSVSNVSQVNKNLK